MPRKNPVPERERDICHRVREIRQTEGLSRVAFARRLDIDSGLLAAYEYGKAPIRYGLVRFLFRDFHVNPTWLATGKSSMHWRGRLYGDFDKSIPDRTLFSEAFERVIEPEIKIHDAIYSEKAIGEVPIFTPPIGMPPDKIPGYVMLNTLPTVVRVLERDPKLAARFVAEVQNLSKRFLTEQSRSAKKKAS